MRHLDDTDQKILQVLRVNGRESLKGIAAKTGLARSTIRYRLAKLEADRVITGYDVKINPGSEAGLSAFLFVRLTETPAHDVIRYLSGHPEVRGCFSLAGDPDLIVDVRVDNSEKLNALRDAIAVLPACAEIRTSIVLKQEI